MSQWQAHETGEWVSDKRAVLFNLTDQRKFPCKEAESAIYCRKNYGPYFGGEQAELAVYTDKNENMQCISHSGKKVYGIGTDDQGKNLLTNQQSE